jgi:hypothetical protein
VLLYIVAASSQSEINYTINTASYMSRMTNNLATNKPLLSAKATLRVIGHMSKFGGPRWGLKAASEYFPENHPILKALERKAGQQEFVGNHSPVKINKYIPELTSQNRLMQRKQNLDKLLNKTTVRSNLLNNSAQVYNVGR